MITIEYSPTGIPIADGALNWWLSHVLTHKNEDRLFEVATGLCIDAVRLAIHEGKIDHNNIQFKYKDQIILSDRFGSLDSWPDGFNDTLDKILYKLME